MFLKQFRDRYAKAALHSEILMVQDGQFVVRVTVDTGDAGKSTGLAADAHLETAEDRARSRALAGFGLDELPDLTVASPPAIAPSTFPPDPNGATIAPTSLLSASPPVSTDLSPALPLPQDPVALPTPRAKPVVAAQKSSQPVLAVPLASSPSLETVPSSSAAPKEEEAVAIALPSRSTAAPVSPSDPPLPVALPPPIDLSDVISQTSIEMTRLQWTIEDGRHYLQQTYQKNSRNDLTEEELIEFLCYLESLPDPVL